MINAQLAGQVRQGEDGSRRYNHRMADAVGRVLLDPESQAEDAVDPAGWIRLRLIGAAVCIVQLGALIAWSYHLWSRFTLSNDFAYYAQAWQRIGTGHLNPDLTISPYHYPNYGHRFLRGHFELAMWPISVLHLVWSSPFTLLVLQDLALAAIVLVTYLWSLDVIHKRWPEPGRVPTTLALLVLAALVVNPYIYETASFDFHLEASATVFLLLAAWKLWKGRGLQAVILAAVALTFGDPVSLYVIGLGLAGVLMSGSRREGLVIAALGGAWLLVIGAFSLNIESRVGTHYGYLIGRPNAPENLSVVTLVVGLFSHPGNVLHVLKSRWHHVYTYVASGGLIGVLTPFGVLLGITVLIPNALNSYEGYISDKSAFQSIAVIPLIAVGSLVVGLWVLRRFGRMAGAVALILALSQVGYVAGSIFPSFRAQWSRLGAADAATLAASLRDLPTSAEVIASPTLIGRFGARQFAYEIVYGNQVFPVRRSEVAFVLEDDGPRSRYVSDVLHARLLRSSPRVAVYSWRPPAGIRSVSVMPPGT